MRASIPVWAKALATFQSVAIWEFPGKKVLKLAWAVNFHKFITLFLILGMMSFYNNYSIGAWVYLALHGIYGYCWLIKDFGFRDHRLESKLSLGGVVNLYWALIALYWLIPWLFISRHIVPSGFDLFFAVSLHTLGVVLMIAADCQRHFSLKYRKALITSGVFKYTRNPNYLGEIMLYSAYAYLANHWIAWLVVAYAVITTFLPNMYAKDYSISRHEGWDEYSKQSSFLIPWRLFNGLALIDLFLAQEEQSQDQEQQGQGKTSTTSTQG